MCPCAEMDGWLWWWPSDDIFATIAVIPGRAYCLNATDMKNGIKILSIHHFSNSRSSSILLLYSGARMNIVLIWDWWVGIQCGASIRWHESTDWLQESRSNQTENSTCRTDTWFDLKFSQFVIFSSSWWILAVLRIQRTITGKDLLTPHLGRQKPAVAANTVPYPSLKIGAVRFCSRIMVSEDKGIGAPSGTVEARNKRYSKTLPALTLNWLNTFTI